METVATRMETALTLVLYMALELSERTWKVGFTTGLGQAPRVRQVPGGDIQAVLAEIAAAKARFKLAPDTPVCSCYEAGRDGFWIHRALRALGILNDVVDSASIEVDRRSRRSKGDRLDVEKLASMLVRYHLGDTRVWRVVRVPSAADEDRRQLHRELATLKRDHTRVVNRVKSLLATHGVRGGGRGMVPAQVPALRVWNGEKLPAELAQRLERECQHARTLEAQMRTLQRKRKALVRNGSGSAYDMVRRLLKLRAIGIETAWVCTMEFFAWRRFRNVREVAALAGLVCAAYQSGNTRHDLGISKAGNTYVRSLAVEVAWAWLRLQPDSELAKWYQRRFAGGGSAQRRKGIVAVARKLLVALWKYLEFGEVPAGAVMKPS